MTGTLPSQLRQTLCALCTLAVLVFSIFGSSSVKALTLGDDGATIVQLFEWTWNDVAAECENVLGPKGYAGVQISPPNEHAVVDDFPWYQRYQAVSYKLASRSGNEDEFRDMVRRCNNAGVAVVADTILNHMARRIEPGEVRRGSAGTEYYRYSYPGLYGFQDFNVCDRPDENIGNYQDRWEVQHCNLVFLADLKTSSPYVQRILAAYIDKLAGIGVRGLRIDAAKHIPADEIRAILDRTQSRHNLFVYQEVIDFGNEPIRGDEYYRNGDVTEMRYSQKLGEVFKKGSLSWLSNFGEAWGFRAHSKSIVFVDNHDNQRGHGAGGDPVTHKDPALYALANVFMLATPYGHPVVMSSYAFSDSSQGPPSYAGGWTMPVYRDGYAHCFAEWICEHRWTAIANMVKFRQVTASVNKMTHWWSNGYQQIAFGRGDRGFVALNKESFPMDQDLQTGMAPGLYCSVVSGDFLTAQNRCTGEAIRVHNDGRVHLHINPMSSVAIHAGAKICE